MDTSPLVRLACVGLNPPRSEDRRRWRQLQSDLVMTANDAEEMGRKRRHRSMAIASLECRRASKSRRCFSAMTRVRRGVLQLQDMADVNQNCILASALCFDPPSKALFWQSNRPIGAHVGKGAESRSERRRGRMVASATEIALRSP